MKLSQKLNDVAINLSVVILKDGSNLKNPRKFSRDDISERVFSECTHPLTKEFLVTDEEYQLILDVVTMEIEKVKRLSNNQQGEGYNEWMRALKWFLNPSNEKGFGSRCYSKCKELQSILGLTDEQITDISQSFDKVTLKNGNHSYRGVDSNNTYRDNTSNLGKITDGLGDNKKDVKRGELGDVTK